MRRVLFPLIPTLLLCSYAAAAGNGDLKSGPQAGHNLPGPFNVVVAHSGDPSFVGKRMDFLLQEMQREVNTMLSKTGNLEITRSGIALKADIEKLAELRDKLREDKDNYWSQIVDIQRQVAAAWVLHAEGKFDEALKAMSGAADAEDKTEKHVITPGPLAPARELYGQMLLNRGMAKEAFAAFEATKAKEPNRFQGYAGAAMAAEKAGDKAAARQNYQKLVVLTANADTERPEVAAARKFLASN